MQLSDNIEFAKQEQHTLSGLNASEQGKRVLAIMRRELARLDKQNRVIGCENKISAAQWLDEFLEQVDSGSSTDTPPGDADGPQASDLSPI